MRDEFQNWYNVKVRKLQSENITLDRNWQELARIIYDSAKMSYGTLRSSSKDWVVENAAVLLPLLERKRDAIVMKDFQYLIF